MLGVIIMGSDENKPYGLANIQPGPRWKNARLDPQPVTLTMKRLRESIERKIKKAEEELRKKAVEEFDKL